MLYSKFAHSRYKYTRVNSLLYIHVQIDLCKDMICDSPKDITTDDALNLLSSPYFAVLFVFSSGPFNNNQNLNLLTPQREIHKFVTKFFN